MVLMWGGSRLKDIQGEKVMGFFFLRSRGVLTVNP